MSGAKGPEPPSREDARLTPGVSPLGTPSYPLLTAQEQEIAALVYARTAATAAELEQAFSTTMKAAQVRGALDSLTARQVLRASKGPGGLRFYVQALKQTDIQQQAARKLADEQFDGGLANAARLLILLVHAHEPASLPELSTFLETLTTPHD